MKKLKYTVSFTTPAFLGNAEQNGQWRTPPFKAQLRQWWRVAYAAKHGFRVSIVDMRREEGLLFGNAWLTHKVEKNHEVSDYCKSLVRLRLDRWDEGKLDANQWQKEWGKDKPETAKGWKVFHPDVGKRIGPTLYLGYGPLDVEKVQLPRGANDYATLLKKGAAIQAGESAELALAWPEAFPAALQKKLEETQAPRIYPEKITERLIYALWLMDRYGTVGGRSRNGWGSYALLPLPMGEGRGEGTALSDTVPLRNWRDCLALDWPHAIGKDDNGKPLIWQTDPHEDWKALMRTLAIVKIGLRTQFLFSTGRNAPLTEDRHWLSYPVTNHSVAAWGSNARLPNQLRFKVRRTEEDQLVGVIFHMPHRPPESFNTKPYQRDIETVWECVHRFLDALCQPADKRSYQPGDDLCPKADGAVLAKQKDQLDKVQLQRIGE
jgi:CRISPR-associated protein Cmr1